MYGRYSKQISLYCGQASGKSSQKPPFLVKLIMWPVMWMLLSSCDLYFGGNILRSTLKLQLMLWFVFLKFVYLILYLFAWFACLQYMSVSAAGDGRPGYQATRWSDEGDVQRVCPTEDAAKLEVLHCILQNLGKGRWGGGELLIQH